MLARDPYDTAAALLDCVCAELGDDCPCLACLTPALTPQDWCCDQCSPNQGQLAVWVDRTYPYSSFPVPETRAPDDCMTVGVAAELVVLLLRCMPADIACDQLTDAARASADDLNAIWRAVTCCPASPLVVRQTRAVRSATCHGIEARVVADLRGVCCPTESPGS